VVTAVYILRTVGKILYGAVQDKHHLALSDAAWYERVSVVVLIVFIAALGMYPFWASSVIGGSLQPIIERLAALNG
jgi:NADH-quinone oxidoreductase subunit M